MEWLLSRPDPPEAGGAPQALVIPSIRALHLARSKLGCHAALRKAGLRAARTAAVLSPGGVARAAEALCDSESEGSFCAREDSGGRWLGSGTGTPGQPAVFRTPAELAEALGAAAPCSYPVVLQTWPGAAVSPAGAAMYTQVRLFYVDHKLESISMGGVEGGIMNDSYAAAAAEEEEVFRAHARPFLTELSGENRTRAILNPQSSSQYDFQDGSDEIAGDVLQHSLIGMM